LLNHRPLDKETIMPLSNEDQDTLNSAQQPDIVDAGGDHPVPPPSGTLTAREALEILRRGEPLSNVRVERLVFRDVFEKPVRLDHVTLVQPRFEGAVFQDEVEFAGCTLDRPGFGKDSEFHKGLNLTGSTLVRTQIHRIIVKGNFNCEHVHTRGKFSLVKCKFEGGVRFWETRFSGWAEIKGCELAGVGDFRSFHAEEGFVLLDCHFKSDVWFRGSSVSKKFEASGSRFDAILDLSKAKLHDYCYLENIVLGERTRFAFNNTIGERIRIRTEHLTGRLDSEERGDFEAAMHEYAFLKRNFESLHRFDQEDWAFYRFKVNQRRSRPQSWAKPWTKLMRFLDWLVLDKGCGYCTDPFRALRTAAILILFFAAIFAVGIDYLPPEVDQHLPFPTTDRGQPPNPTDRFLFINRVTVGMYESVSTFISGLNGLSEMSKGPMVIAQMIEALAGTLLWGLFIVSFSRKVIR
jgi:hypothetical protein